MRILNLKVFDDLISGTTANWLSSSEFDSAIGKADGFAMQTVTTGVAGIQPTLTILTEHSCDGENWVWSENDDLINRTPITEDSSYLNFSNVCAIPALGAFVRFRVALGGTSPACRLKLYVTGRQLPF